ncbi:MAG: PhzF family phenazine biosynthesis protein [Deltaproteobacteria bacterium]|nr:MAG: PhzF family phenazine biosynthesis protein [Deltaproteobacteria bacterium]
MKRPCYVVDAFSAEPFLGNPAGVLLEAADLDSGAMQRIANELKHSETAFPLPAREPTTALHLRWFTPESEVAFCGHATLAAFHVLVEEARRIRVPEQGTVRIAFTCKSGKLQAELSRQKGKLRVLIETPASRFEPAQVPAEVLAALGLVPEVLDPKIAPQRSAILEGNLYLCLRDHEALARCKPQARELIALGKEMGVAGFVAYTLNPKAGVDVAVRCFFPGYGILEDPVTGSAAGQLGALLQSALPQALPRKLVFTQGEEMGRPGRVELEVRPDAAPGSVRGWIGGAAVTVLRGELEL